MALRVLLADESTTIRKAVLMVLADYGPDVKSVPSGLDVLSVAKSFDPDIILVDVLLTKKNGYEVSLELKSDPSTSRIPIILMWSNFMQLDFTQFAACKANDSIEKPFEPDAFRAKIENLLPNLKSHPLKGVLTLPRLPNIVEDDDFIKQKTTYESLSQEDKDNIKAVKEVVQPKPEKKLEEVKPEPEEQDEDARPAKKKKTKDASEDEWGLGNASQFVVETENFGEFEEVKSINSLDDEPSLQSQINEQIQNYIKDSPVVSHRAKESLNQKNYSAFDEQLMREEIRQIAERVCWQVIPEVTEKVVREELAKLLKGIENNS
ncbi:MAG: putative phosphate regulon protein [Pseudobdellovibrio sp.]|jgi:CheY-like chemotaxis protein|nr:putative phosphate regulon protein [Pseudobdellovibrio sp.]